MVPIAPADESQQSGDATEARKDAYLVVKWWAGFSIGSFVIFFLAAACAYGGCEGLQAVAWCGASEVVGATAGFLFGIPKVLQRSVTVEAAAPPNGSPSPQPATVSAPGNNAITADGYQIRVNTNLEEISDWLTKMIVGVGLVELKSAVGPLSKLTWIISNGLGARHGEARGFALAILVLFLFTGFLFGYLTTRLYLQLAFARADRSASWPTARFMRAVVASLVTGVGAKKTSAGPAAELAQWDTDPNAGQFGGRPAQNGRLFAATISSSSALAPNSPLCLVHLDVRSTDKTRPLTRSVTIFLHPTFDVQTVEVPVGPNGVAEYDFLSWGWFTVGAQTSDGTRLELNLRTVPGGTPAFYDE